MCQPRQLLPLLRPDDPCACDLQDAGWPPSGMPLSPLTAGWKRSPGYWVPAAQVPDGLAVLPLNGVFEQMGKLPAGGDAGYVGDPAAGPDRDHEPLVVEGERLRLLAPQ